jgi:hypothetical protein
VDSSVVAALRASNLGLKFVIELAAIASLAYWGASLDGPLLSVLMMLLSAVALRPAGEGALAVVMAIVVLLNALLLSAFGQWEA